MTSACSRVNCTRCNWAVSFETRVLELLHAEEYRLKINSAQKRSWLFQRQIITCRCSTSPARAHRPSLSHFLLKESTAGRFRCLQYRSEERRVGKVCESRVA